MFLAVYENGAIDMKHSFEMLHKSGKILFFAQSQVATPHIYYNLINSKCELTPLELHGCKIHRIIQYKNQEEICVELEVESPNRGIEKVGIYRQPEFYINPLTVVVSVIRTIDLIGYDRYCGR